MNRKCTKKQHIIVLPTDKKCQCGKFLFSAMMRIVSGTNEKAEVTLRIDEESTLR